MKETVLGWGDVFEYLLVGGVVRTPSVTGDIKTRQEWRAVERDIEHAQFLRAVGPNLSVEGFGKMEVQFIDSTIQRDGVAEVPLPGRSDSRDSSKVRSICLSGRSNTVPPLK